MNNIPVTVHFLNQVWNGWKWRKQARSIPKLFGLAELKFFIENPHAVPEILNNPPNTPDGLVEAFRRQGRSSRELSFGFYGNIHRPNRISSYEFYVLTRSKKKDIGNPTNIGNGWYCGRISFDDAINPVFFPALAYPEGTTETLKRIRWDRFSVRQCKEALREDAASLKRIADYESGQRYDEEQKRRRENAANFYRRFGYMPSWA